MRDRYHKICQCCPGCSHIPFPKCEGGPADERLPPSVLRRPEIGYRLPLIALHRLDQGSQIRCELFGFLSGERLRHGLF